jgi:hypothetical protein
VRIVETLRPATLRGRRLRAGADRPGPRGPPTRHDQDRPSTARSDATRLADLAVELGSPEQLWWTMTPPVVAQPSAWCAPSVRELTRSDLRLSRKCRTPKRPASPARRPGPRRIVTNAPSSVWPPASLTRAYRARSRRSPRNPEGAELDRHRARSIRGRGPARRARRVADAGTLVVVTPGLMPESTLQPADGPKNARASSDAAH